MKKLFILLSLFGANTIFAQTYTISPSHSVTYNLPYNTLSIIDIFQVNTGSAPIVLKYELLDSNMVTGWDLSLCDYGHCIPGLPLSGTMDTVPVGGQGFLGLNVDPYTINGSGWAKYYVYQDGFHATGDTLTWFVTAGPSGINVNGKTNAFTFYPNPVVNELIVKSAASIDYVVNVSIFNATGQLVYENKISEMENKIDVSVLANGLYTVQLTDKNKQRIQVKKFVINK